MYLTTVFQARTSHRGFWSRRPRRDGSAGGKKPKNKSQTDSPNPTTNPDSLPPSTSSDTGTIGGSSNASGGAASVSEAPSGASTGINSNSAPVSIDTGSELSSSSSSIAQLGGQSDSSSSSPPYYSSSKSVFPSSTPSASTSDTENGTTSPPSSYVASTSINRGSGALATNAIDDSHTPMTIPSSTNANPTSTPEPQRQEALQRSHTGTITGAVIGTIFGLLLLLLLLLMICRRRRRKLRHSTSSVGSLMAEASGENRSTATAPPIQINMSHVTETRYSRYSQVAPGLFNFARFRSSVIPKGGSNAGFPERREDINTVQAQPMAENPFADPLPLSPDPFAHYEMATNTVDSHAAGTVMQQSSQAVPKRSSAGTMLDIPNLVLVPSDSEAEKKLDEPDPSHARRSSEVMPTLLTPVDPSPLASSQGGSRADNRFSRASSNRSIHWGFAL